MSLKVAVRKIQKGPYLKLFFSIIRVDSGEVTSQEFNINDLAMVRFKFVYELPGLECFFSVKKPEIAKKYTVKMNITFHRFHYSRQLVCTEDWTEWIHMNRGTYYFQSEMSIEGFYFYGLVVTMSVIQMNLLTFPQLYEETDFCDFHLSTADGSGKVAVHKVCLITHSDVFKRMLISKWKETAEGCIEIKDVTLPTLQHLKDYIYLGTLPDDGLRPLLLLAKCYMMESLKEECVVKLAETVKPEDLNSLQEFAADNRLYELIRAIVQLTPDETVQKAHEIKCKEQQNASKNDKIQK